MREDSSLFLLANVALENPNRDLNYRCAKKKRQVKTKTLKVTILNGEDYAEITDLKCMPISILFKIFIEKLDNTKEHSLAYVCKYGLKQPCNTRFTDIRGNKINCLEHLIQCHLLEHLTKTKTGSLIKLPKPFSKSPSTTPSFIEPKQSNGGSSEPHNAFEEIEWQSADKILSECKTENQLQNAVKESKSENFAINDFSPSQISVDSTKNMKLHEETSSRKEQSVEVDIKRVKFDHAYADMSISVTTGIPGSSIRTVLRPIKYQSIDVDKLYYLNSESSSELNEFMTHETLIKPASIFMKNRKLRIVGQLPLVGCEVEVITDKFTANVDSSRRSPLIPDLECNEVLSSKNESTLPRKIEQPVMKTVAAQKGSQKEDVRAPKRKLSTVPENHSSKVDVKKENKHETTNNFAKKPDMSILKTALLKESNNKKPVINISNIWNNINVQYF